jgi:hypothetical protein
LTVPGPVASESIAAERRHGLRLTRSEEAMTSLGKSLIILSLSLVPAFIACNRTSPIHNVTNAVATTKQPKLDEVRNAIERGGQSLGWEMMPAGPGHVVGTLYIRGHMAQVDIPYTTTSYSINYKDSQNLDYDGSNIHSNYNGWIRKLDEAIARQLAAL